MGTGCSTERGENETDIKVVDISEVEMKQEGPFNVVFNFKSERG